MRLRVLAVCVCVVLPALASAQIPLTPEFQINTYTTSAQAGQAIAADAAGNFVVMWYSYFQDGSSAGIYGRRYQASGTPIGGAEFRVNTYTTDTQRSVVVASDANGRLAVVWESYGQDGDRYGVYGRRYDSTGIPGPEFRVNDYTTHHQDRAKVAMDASGSFVVVWESYNQLGPGRFWEVFARRYNAAGVAQGATEFLVNAYTTGSQTDPDVAMDAVGNFVVVWRSEQDGSGPGIFGQRFNAAGVPQGGEFQINTYTTGYQNFPAVSMSTQGDFVVTWESDGQDGDQSGVFAQRFDAAGVRQGVEFRVNQYTTGDQSSPDVALDGQRNFVVTWTGPFQDGSDYGVLARAYHATGVAEGNEFVLNAFTPGNQLASALVPQPGGRFVTSWVSYFQDGDHFGMFGRRYATDPIFADGFESADLSAWSASSTDGGDLSVSASAALNFTGVGLQGVADDTAGLYVEDRLPDDEGLYRARFYFDTNGFDPGEALNHRRTRLFIAFEESPNRRLAAIVLRRIGGAYALLGRARLDDDSQYDTGFFPIGDGVHFVELAWKRASGPDANDGAFELWIDGTSVHSATTLDNSISAVDFVRLGALSVKTGASGTLFWDEFVSRRLSYIGP
jgi:hypothetical protein